MSDNMERLTNAAAVGVPACQIQYATKPPFNSNNSLILVLEVANFALYEVATRKRIGPLPWCGDSNNPLWSKTDPDLFYFTRGNEFCIYRVSTESRTVMRRFDEYSSITDMGEGDLGDGEHIALLGVRSDGAAPDEIFVYEKSTDTKGSIALAGAGLDAIYITPESNVITSRPEGIFLFDSEMRYLRQVTHLSGHKDVTRDTDGSDCMVITDNTDNSIKKIKLADGSATVILPPLPWNLAVNVSCPDSAGFCIVSTYGKDVEGEILQVGLDGSVKSIAKYPSSLDYDSQPRGSVSCDGKMLAYNVSKDGMTDVYLAELDSVSLPAPKPESLTWHRFPNQTALTAENFPAIAGQAGFVYDGGYDTKLIFHDGTHRWFIPMTQIK